MTGSTSAMTDAEADELMRRARHHIQVNQWTEARSMLHQLALRLPHDTKLRALLAHARGHEAAQAGNLDRAHEEWRRALMLDPNLEDAKQALRTRPRRRTSLIDKLFGRTN